MKHKPLPPLEELKESLDYNPDTGIFTWIKCRSNNVKVGQEAGTLNTVYRVVRFNGIFYKGHRLAYYMYHGIDPLEKQIDHKDGDPSNNKIDNLRLATHPENGSNRKQSKNKASGKNGVSWYSRTQKWEVYITASNKRKFLGYFTNKEDAIKAREEAEIKYYGEFRRQD